MKKFIKKSMILLMAGVMVVLPVTMSAEAKETVNYTIEENTIPIDIASTYSFGGYGQINTNGVYLRAGASTETTSLEWMAINETVHIDKNGSKYDTRGNLWYHVKRSKTGTVGYVRASYIRVLG